MLDGFGVKTMEVYTQHSPPSTKNPAGLEAENRVLATAIHIDSVRLSHTYRRSDLLTSDEFLERDFEIGFKHREESGVICTAVAHPYLGRTNEPRIFVTTSEHGYSGISLDLSFAKFIDGSGLGAQTDDDIEFVFDAVQDFVRWRMGVDFDARTAKVKRMDANADFPVGEPLTRPIINSITCPSARMTRGTVGETTKQYYNRSRTIIAYGKMEEMQAQHKKRRATIEDVEAAEGLLRVEARYRGQAVQRLADKIGVPVEAQNLLKMPAAERIVAAALKELGLDTPKASSQSRDQRLLDNFGKDAPTMLGVLEWRARHGEDFWKSLDWSQAKYYRLRSELRAANLWDSAPDEALPALAIAA